MYLMVHVWKSQNGLCELIISFYYIGSGIKLMGLNWRLNFEAHDFPLSLQPFQSIFFSNEGQE